MSQILYESLLNKDAKWLGRQYVAIKTTGIYCNLNCPCKKPLYKNTSFFSSLTQCLVRGYRECKVCHPLISLAEVKKTDLNQTAIEYIKWLEREDFPNKSYKKHPIASLESLQVIKTSFKKLTDFSLGKYIRLKRTGYILTRNIKSITYPNKIFFSYIDTPLGEMVSCYSEKGLVLLEFVDRKSLESELIKVKETLKGYFVYSETDQHHTLSQQMSQYFNGKRKKFSIQFDLMGTDFQKQVWLQLIKIPYSHTISYSEQAKQLNKSNAVRAIANANGKNMIAIVIPCHRVIASNGDLSGYGGGIERKRKLIEMELNNNNFNKFNQFSVDFD